MAKGQEIYDKLLKRGVPAPNAAILVGSMKQESGFNPAAWNAKEKAGGLIQWRKDRLQNLMDFAKERGTKPGNLETQLDFLVHEMTLGSEAESGGKFLEAGTDPDTLNKALKGYIRWGDDSDATRLENAKAFFVKPAGEGAKGQASFSTDDLDALLGGPAPDQTQAQPIPAPVAAAGTANQAPADTPAAETGNEAPAPSFTVDDLDSVTGESAAPASSFSVEDLDTLIGGPTGVHAAGMTGSTEIDPRSADISEGEQEVNSSGKGDQGLGTGEVAPMTYVEDAKKSLGGGLVKGVTGLAGLPGDIGRLAIAGMGKINNDDPAEIARLQQNFPIPGSADITDYVENKLTGKLHEPQTTVGKFSEVVGEFAPAAVTGGGSVIANTLKGSLTKAARIAGRKTAMTVVPAVASEGAAELAPEEYEGYARVLGAVGGGLGTAKVLAGAPAKEMRKLAPDYEKVVAEKDALYGRLENGGVAFDSGHYDNFVSDLTGKLKKFRPKRAPMSHDLLESMDDYKGRPASFSEVEGILSDAKAILREQSASNADKAAAHIIVDNATKFFDQAALTTNGTIRPNQVAGLAKQAREMARRKILADQVLDMQGAAEGGGYVSGVESGLKNKFASFLKSNKRKGLTDSEKKAFAATSTREGVNNLTSSLGGRLGLLANPLAMAGAGYAKYGVPGAIGGFVMGSGLSLGARKAAEISVRGASDNALKTVLAGKQAQDAAEKAIKGSIVRNRLTTTVNTIRAEQANEKNKLTGKIKPIRLPNGSMLWNPTYEDLREYGGQ